MKLHAIVCLFNLHSRMDHHSTLVFPLGSEEESCLLLSDSCYTVCSTVHMSGNIFCDLFLSLLIYQELSVYAVLKEGWQMCRIQILKKNTSAAQFDGKEGSDLKVGQHFDYF